MKEERNTSLELMRILSILFIVICHILIHGQVYENSGGFTRIILTFICSFFIVHVPSFILITGYFQYNKKMKLSKVIKINNTCWFYTILIMIIFMIFFHTRISLLKIIQDAIPIVEPYWFIMVYIVLYLISPILNKVISNSTREEHKKIIFLLFFLISLLPCLTKGEFLYVNRGYSLSYFIFLYFIGAYLHKYPARDYYHFQNITQNRYRLVLGLILLLVNLLNVLLIYFSKNLVGNEVLEYIKEIIEYNFTAYNNPLIIISTICYFLFFESFNIKSKIINLISSTTIGIYMIHDNDYIRQVLYSKLGFTQELYSISVIPKVFLIAIIIVIICAIIEGIRSFIFKLIYNSKLANWNRKKYRSFIESFGIDINW